ncbi:MAG: DUF2236 domain-containing protein [Myxococcales bacterium]|nr:DUF2236 domain-containing protein [Myxococcales bacterium]
MRSPSPQAPGRWRAERLVSPPPRGRLIARVLGVHVRVDDPDVIRLREGLVRVDPVADEFVAWSAGEPQGRGRRLFEAAVEGGLAAVPDAPECLVRWFEPLERAPAWLDREALRLACRTSWRTGTDTGLVLSATALMGGYRSSAAVKPLAMTGALDRMVVRRIAETSRFVLDVLESDTLERRSAGFKSACRVRLMHALVRRSLTRRADWDWESWGAPINQTDMAATQLEFSAIYLFGLMVLGYRFTAEERDAIMHLWRYVGVVMGVDDAIMAHTYAEGRRHMYIHAMTNPPADEDSRALARALHELPLRLAETPEARAYARLQMRYRTAVSRLTLGDEAVDDIGLPAEPLYPLVALQSVARFGLETLRRRLPLATERAVQTGRALQRGVIAGLVGDAAVRYVPYAERSAASSA